MKHDETTLLLRQQASDAEQNMRRANRALKVALESVEALTKSIAFLNARAIPVHTPAAAYHIPDAETLMRQTMAKARPFAEQGTAGGAS